MPSNPIPSSHHLLEHPHIRSLQQTSTHITMSRVRSCFSLLQLTNCCLSLLLADNNTAEAFSVRHPVVVGPSFSDGYKSHNNKISCAITAKDQDTTEQDDVLIYSDEWEKDDNDDNLLAVSSSSSPSRNPPVSASYLDEHDTNLPWKQNPRWHSLSPKVKARIRAEAQQKAIANKKKREPSDDKKRRLMFRFKKSQQEKKRASRVKRSISFDERTPLSALAEGMDVTGTVISLTNFGAYVDVGTECDGLLHVSQMSSTNFIEHPRQVMSPGDQVTVTVRSTNPELKKLHLTMLSKEMLEKEVEDKAVEHERIPLDDIDADDELWGEIRRVTDFGAYVELGAIVDGFLHFMDHPQFSDHLGQPPSDFMTIGDRIRVWVSDVDIEKSRVKLTANRPQDLPGPRREVL